MVSSRSTTATSSWTAQWERGRCSPSGCRSMDKLRALVVDDEESVCEAVRAILELEGFDVTTTLSSPEAVELVRKGRYDLIVSDLKMPVMDGMQFYDKVRELGNTSIFILMTAYSSLYSVEAAM